MSQDGEISYFREAGEPILDSDRDLDHTIGIVQDVTELYLAKTAARQTTEKANARVEKLSQELQGVIDRTIAEGMSD